MLMIREEVRTFVLENFLFGEDGQGLHDDSSFLEEGLIDSTGVLELVAFLEQTYGIAIDDDELVPENLDSIRNVTYFVERKRQAVAAS
jgi:acyl carrier protein